LVVLVQLVKEMVEQPLHLLYHNVVVVEVVVVEATALQEQQQTVEMVVQLMTHLDLELLSHYFI
jgi:hypothetical protein